MSILFYTLNIVYICVFKTVPRPIASVKHMDSYSVRLKVCRCVCVCERMYVHMCRWEHSINMDTTVIGFEGVG
jgi:hypothetical protein